MDGRIRVLVVDGSTLMGWLVQSLASSRIDVICARTFDDARRHLQHHPPDAAIFNITPCDLPWHELRDLCRCRNPAIPFLCISTVEECENELEICGGAERLCKPVPIPELRRRVNELVSSAYEIALSEGQDLDGFSEPDAALTPS